MPFFQKKPVVIEAVQFNGNGESTPALFRLALSSIGCKVLVTDNYVEVETLEGTMRGDKGDWLIKGVKGELYPCKPDIFEQTYEPVEE